jgi:homoserine kinase
MIRAFAPATVGNIACGFDVLGLALERPGDEVRVIPQAAPGVTLLEIHGDAGRLPRDPARNAATIAAQAVLCAVGLEDQVGMALSLIKGLPLASGLGGSAASAVAGAVGADAFLQSTGHTRGLSLDVLLACAEAGEREGAGAGHLDNAAPALHGGICLVRPGATRTGAGGEVVPLPIPDGLAVAVVHPRIEIRTEEARAVLGTTVPLHDAVLQWANTASFVAALYEGNLGLLSRSLVDYVAEPRRAGQVPGFHEAMKAAKAAGALGGSLSGSGPSVFVLCPDAGTAVHAADAMARVFESRGIEALRFSGPIARRGARVLQSGEDLS